MTAKVIPFPSPSTADGEVDDDPLEAAILASFELVYAFAEAHPELGALGAYEVLAGTAIRVTASASTPENAMALALCHSDFAAA